MAWSPQGSWVAVPVGFPGFQIFDHADVRGGKEDRRPGAGGEEVGGALVPADGQHDGADITGAFDGTGASALQRVDYHAAGLGAQPVGLPATTPRARPPATEIPPA